jgi:hypothetical protein
MIAAQNTAYCIDKNRFAVRASAVKKEQRMLLRQNAGRTRGSYVGNSRLSRIGPLLPINAAVDHPLQNAGPFLLQSLC